MAGFYPAPLIVEVPQIILQEADAPDRVVHLGNAHGLAGEGGLEDEVIEALLLLQDVEGGWLGGFLLEGQVQAFVTSVLLGMAGLDALQADAES